MSNNEEETETAFNNQRATMGMPQKRGNDENPEETAKDKPELLLTQDPGRKRQRRYNKIGKHGIVNYILGKAKRVRRKSWG